jgi:hypothetical protein
MWALSAVIALGACYSPSVASCVYACGTNESCPSGLSCVAGTCVADGDSCGPTDDGGHGSDALGLPNFRDVTWGSAAALDGTTDLMHCERSPVVTPDLQYLLYTRTTATATVPLDCLNSGEVVSDNWNNASPSSSSTPSHFHGEEVTIVQSVLDSAHAGLPAGEVLIAFSGGTADERTSSLIPYSDDLLAPKGSAASIPGVPANAQLTFTADGTHMIVSDNMDLKEGVGSIMSGYVFSSIPVLNSPLAELSPGISPDGRVLLFARPASSTNPETDIWVSRRDSVTDPWGVPERLAHGAAEINSDASEYEPFIAANGDLVFVSTRGGVLRHLYYAKGTL